VIIALILGALPVAAAGQPALPALAFDATPAAVRASFEQAYADARERPGDASRIGRLAMLLHAYEQYPLAERCYGIARALQPEAFEWAYLTAVTQFETGRHAAASATFRSALALDPAYLPARIYLADSLLRAGEVDGSSGEYERLLRDFPELPIAHYGVGRVAALRGEPLAAIRHYTRAVELSPQFGTALYALALAQRTAGAPGLAAQYMERYRQWGNRRPAPPDPVMDRIRALRVTARDQLEAASRLAAEGRLEEAAAMNVKALQADPDATQAHVNLISLYGRLGRSDDAEKHYRAAIAGKSSLADAHYNYGVLTLSTGRPEEARLLFERALTVNPFHAQAHNNLAALLAGQRRLTEAETHYLQAIANDPGHRAARFNLGRTLVALGRPHQAVAHFRWLLANGSDEAEHVQLMAALAAALFAAGERAEGIAYAERALRDARTRGQAGAASSIESLLAEMRAGAK
jgi:tetratricopeptide (TPR) repeat protein